MRVIQHTLPNTAFRECCGRRVNLEHADTCPRVQRWRIGDTIELHDETVIVTAVWRRWSETAKVLEWLYNLASARDWRSTAEPNRWRSASEIRRMQ